MVQKYFVQGSVNGQDVILSFKCGSPEVAEERAKKEFGMVDIKDVFQKSAKTLAFDDYKKHYVPSKGRGKARSNRAKLVWGNG